MGENGGVPRPALLLAQQPQQRRQQQRLVRVLDAFVQDKKGLLSPAAQGKAEAALRDAGALDDSHVRRVRGLEDDMTQMQRRAWKAARLLACGVKAWANGAHDQQQQQSQQQERQQQQPQQQERQQYLHHHHHQQQQHQQQQQQQQERQQEEEGHSTAREHRGHASTHTNTHDGQPHDRINLREQRVITTCVLYIDLLGLTPHVPSNALPPVKARAPRNTPAPILRAAQGSAKPSDARDKQATHRKCLAIICDTVLAAIPGLPPTALSLMLPTLVVALSYRAFGAAVSSAGTAAAVSFQVATIRLKHHNTPRDAVQSAVALQHTAQLEHSDSDSDSDGNESDDDNVDDGHNGDDDGSPVTGDFEGHADNEVAGEKSSRDNSSSCTASHPASCAAATSHASNKLPSHRRQDQALCDLERLLVHELPPDTSLEALFKASSGASSQARWVRTATSIFIAANLMRRHGVVTLLRMLLTDGSDDQTTQDSKASSTVMWQRAQFAAIMIGTPPRQPFFTHHRYYARVFPQLRAVICQGRRVRGSGASSSATSAAPAARHDGSNGSGGQNEEDEVYTELSLAAQRAACLAVFRLFNADPQLTYTHFLRQFLKPFLIYTQTAREPQDAQHARSSASPQYTRRDEQRHSDSKDDSRASNDNGGNSVNADDDASCLHSTNSILCSSRDVEESRSRVCASVLRWELQLPVGDAEMDMMDAAYLAFVVDAMASTGQQLFLETLTHVFERVQPQEDVGPSQHASGDGASGGVGGGGHAAIATTASGVTRERLVIGALQPSSSPPTPSPSPSSSFDVPLSILIRVERLLALLLEHVAPEAMTDAAKGLALVHALLLFPHEGVTSAALNVLDLLLSGFITVERSLWPLLDQCIPALDRLRKSTEVNTAGTRTDTRTDSNARPPQARGTATATTTGGSDYDDTQDASVEGLADRLYVSIRTRAACWSGLGENREAGPSHEQCDSTEGATAVDELQRIFTDIKDPLMPVRAHALVQLRKLINAKREQVKENLNQILGMLSPCLGDPDSYLYLAAIDALAALGAAFPAAVLPKIMAEFRDGSLAIELRLKIGQSLMQVVRALGSALPKHVHLVLPAMLDMCRRGDETLRASCLSNLAEICQLLRFALQPHMSEVAHCISQLALRDPSEQVRRGAMHVLVSILKGLGADAPHVLSGHIRPLVHMCRSVEDTDQDGVTRFHAAAALHELQSIARSFLKLNS
ncbi:hypothetical protein PTSG_04042 [Salpingoeca rosetta]|uniref:TOG domain-containing protein n=1 Tax=Salpingoeca rosetta (strain ATCC 50818 / BSB-021) TaxID=946362 RepID=F2U7L8_SALR5|nr:uncharacterized protein PTSG_04042 [Salpingoeca rosetta]EGD83435.1 hypothetical protein PTSG_04042 [Salpingoeca rosetta]|eukprot:XP_004994939.1 hypothetical protein PTSG_04042 [Salpingoeca rosetta]